MNYSYDGGATWLPLSLDMTDTTLPVGPGDLLGSPVYFQVQASNGFNTTTAQVGPIQLTQTPQIAASLTSLDFRNGLPGISVERDLVLTDTGTGPLQVTKVAFDNPAFNLISPILPVTLFGGGDMTLQVTFTAPSAGPAQGKMTITSNAAGTPSLIIPLTATGITSAVPDPVVRPTSVDFGQVATGSTNTQTVALQNFGPGPMQVNSLSVTGTGFTLGAGLAQTPFDLGTDSVSIGVQFAPTQAGAQSGSLTITTSDPAHPSIVVSLRGTGDQWHWRVLVHPGGGHAESTLLHQRGRHWDSHRHGSGRLLLDGNQQRPKLAYHDQYRQRQRHGELHGGRQHRHGRDLSHRRHHGGRRNVDRHPSGGRDSDLYELQHSRMQPDGHFAVHAGQHRQRDPLGGLVLLEHGRDQRSGHGEAGIDHGVLGQPDAVDL